MRRRTYRILRGELEPSKFVRKVQGPPPCCAETGCEWKIYRFFATQINAIEDSDLKDSLSHALFVASKVYTKKGGGDNTRLEGLFSLLRMLALKRWVCLRINVVVWIILERSACIHPVTSSLIARCFWELLNESYFSGGYLYLWLREVWF